MTAGRGGGRRACVAAWVVCALIGPVACGSRPEPDAQVRVDQVGYAVAETKTAMVLAPRDANGTQVTVVDEGGRNVLTTVIGRSRGGWNARFPRVHPVDISGLRAPGTYRVRVSGAVTAQSPPFRIGTPAELFGPLVGNAVTYLQAHRDGAEQLPGPWRRAPAHLDDRQADVYEPPEYDDDGRMTAPLVRTGGPVDVEGGWYDAGDFLKFTHTAAYAVIALLLVQRDGPAPPGLPAEAAYGLRWLEKMVDGDTGRVLAQVGIGSGMADPDGGFLGDHDTWRLPQADDQLPVEPGDRRYYQRYRPVFPAAAAGEPLSPNLAGRVAAAFALAAQVYAADDPERARRYLDTAARVHGLAATSDVGDLVTTQPRTFYPETSWTDDMAAGATELALAGARLDDPRTPGWADEAGSWVRADADDGRTAALSVYDLSVLADAELLRLNRTVPLGEDTTDAVRRDLRRRLDAGVTAAARAPLGAAAGAGGSDYAARQLGYAASAALYREATGDGEYAAFGTAQRAVALGANGWGTSLVVGAGTTYPRCPHDQITSLTTGSGGASPPMVGAVVNGPNTADRVGDLLEAATASTCSTDSFRRYDRDDAHYTDDVRISATSEPSIDFAATGLLAFALTARQP